MDNPNWVKMKCIGRGSFGTVNLAADKTDGRLFAVKSVQMNSSCSKQVEALENEIQILKSLNSPYVVEYLGHDFTKDSSSSQVFKNLHIEYLPGGTLAELPLPDVDESTVRSLTWCLTSALRYLHGKGIVHCDVKGRNVLVGPKFNYAKLADFGSAKEYQGPELELNPCGSPLWMAPEVVRGEYQGPESDVWSLGCTLIEMITGRPPWDDHDGDTLFLIAYSDKLPLIPAELSEVGQDFLDKCLRRNPSERWSCDQLLLHPFLSSCSPPIMDVHWSPKCVLDRFDSSFSDDEIDHCNSNSNTSSLHCTAKRRIQELAGNSVAIWESDGWMEVRNFAAIEVEVETCCSSGDDHDNDKEQEKERVISSFKNLSKTEDETTGANFEYFDNKKKKKWEYLDIDDIDSPKGLYCKYYGSVANNSDCQCRYGFKFNHRRMEFKRCDVDVNNNNNSCCNLKSLYHKYYKCNINVTCVIYYLLDLINMFVRTCDYVSNASAFAVDRNACGGYLTVWVDCDLEKKN